MATLLIFSAKAMHGDIDQQLVTNDGAAGLEMPAVGRPAWAFDDTDEEAIITAEVEMPSQYTGSGLTAKLHLYTKTATDDARFDVFVEAKTPNSDTTPDMEAAASWDSANSATDTGGTAGYPLVLSITLTNADSVAAGDSVRFGVRRDCDHADDDTNGDWMLTGLTIEDDG